MQPEPLQWSHPWEPRPKTQGWLCFSFTVFQCPRAGPQVFL